MIVFSMICEHSGKNKSPFFSFTTGHVLKDAGHVISVDRFEKFSKFLISKLNLRKIHQVSALYLSNWRHCIK